MSDVADTPAGMGDDDDQNAAREDAVLDANPAPAGGGQDTGDSYEERDEAEGGRA